MADRSKYASTKRVYETVDGVTRLKYPVGFPIPVEEAQRQGLVKGTAKTAAPGVSTTVAPGEGVSVTYDRHERLGESEADKAARNQAARDAANPPAKATKPTARKPAARKTAAKKARKPAAKKPTTRPAADTS